MITIRAARPADAAAIAGIHADAWRVPAAGQPPSETIAEYGYDSRLTYWKKLLVHSPQGVFLAEDDALGPMGFVSCGAAHDPIRTEAGNFRGEVHALFVRPVCQGMGLGQKLFETAIGNLRKAGYSAVMLWAPAENSVCKFYERMAGQPIGDRMVTAGGQDLREVAYGWGGRLTNQAPALPKNP